MTKTSGEEKGRKEALKEVIRLLHEGADPERVKEKFKSVVSGATPFDIATIEEELIEEGIPREEIQRLCDVHLALFRESLEKEGEPAPAGHPIGILMEEHKLILNLADELRSITREIGEAKNADMAGEALARLDRVVGQFRGAESHYLREENVLFPYLERHGVTQPPAIMWMEHDKIRGIKKRLHQLVETHEETAFQDFSTQLREIAISLSEMLSGHFYKENRILFPTALRVIGDKEWTDIRRQFDELGYCPFTPRPPEMLEGERGVKEEGSGDVISFDTGSFSLRELESLLNSLPVDITFVDREDTVRYFNQSKDRIFVRTKAVIGRKVQRCHPQKSIHLVNKILEEFKSGQRGVAEFWIDMKGRLIYIRYFAVRDKNGEYLGCVEVTQDITDIKRIEGEKRLL